MRARDRDLPELELLALDEEEPAPSVSTVDVKSKRWWPIALGAAVLAAAILVTGHDGGSQVASAPTTPSTLEHVVHAGELTRRGARCS